MLKPEILKLALVSSVTEKADDPVTVIFVFPMPAPTTLTFLFVHETGEDHVAEPAGTDTVSPSLAEFTAD